MKAFLGFRGLFLPLSLMWTCAGDWSAIQVQCTNSWFYARIKPTIFHNIYMAPDEAFLGDYCAVTRFEPEVFYEFLYHLHDCGIIIKILQETLLLKTKIMYVSKLSNNQAEMPLSCVVRQ
ncbi:putative oocyte-secreted protein 1 homolog [Loxodonta africana]|uniref:putative oocyte-secreted protein 1 homolog n=1 Tax=Loxodonta africana TaxID=9785 RepID=UPI0030D13D7A